MRLSTLNLFQSRMTSFVSITMTRTSLLLSAFLILCAASSAPSQTETRAEPPSKTAVDLHGDALPPGAVARFGTLRLRHRSEVEQMAISPDGSLLASAGAGAHVWDLKTGQEVERFRGKLQAEKMAFSADGKTLLSGSEAGVLQQWDVSSGKLLETFKTPKGWPATAEKEKLRLDGDDRWLASSPDRRTMAVYRDGVVSLNDAASGKLLHSLKDGSRGRGFIPIVEFSADGRLIVVANQDYSIRVWETATGKQLHSLPGHRGSIECLAFSPDGKSLASGSSFDGTVIVWDVATSKARHIWDDHYLAVWAVAWSPDGSLLASGEGCNGMDRRESLIRLFDPRTGRPLRQITAHLNNVHSLAFSPDGKRLASVGWDARARVWDPLTGKRLQQLRSSDHLQTVSFSGDGKTLLLTAHPSEVEAYRTEDWELIHHLKPDPQRDRRRTHVAFLPDGKTVVTREQNSKQGLRDISAEICFRSVEDDRLLRSVTIKDVQPTFGFDRIALSPKGDLYAEAVNDKTGNGVRVWDTATGKLLGSFYGHAEKLSALAFSRDSRWLATGSRDTTILLWDLSASKLSEKEPRP
jgi:WD40 repeat protein